MDEYLIKLCERYDKGFIDGLTAFAHWKDGEQYVGTTGTTLKQAIADRQKLWSYYNRGLEVSDV